MCELLLTQYMQVLKSYWYSQFSQEYLFVLSSLVIFMIGPSCLVILTLVTEYLTHMGFDVVNIKIT